MNILIYIIMALYAVYVISIEKPELFDAIADIITGRKEG